VTLVEDMEVEGVEVKDRVVEAIEGEAMEVEAL
jgi:hypothetical protein